MNRKAGKGKQRGDPPSPSLRRARPSPHCQHPTRLPVSNIFPFPRVPSVPWAPDLFVVFVPFEVPTPEPKPLTADNSDFADQTAPPDSCAFCGFSRPFIGWPPKGSKSAGAQHLSSEPLAPSPPPTFAEPTAGRLASSPSRWSHRSQTSPTSSEPLASHLLASVSPW